MAKPRLNGPRVMASIRQRIPAAVPQHVRVDRERQTSASADGFHLTIDRVRGELATTLRREHVGRCSRELPQHQHFIASDWMSRWPAVLDPRHMKALGTGGGAHLPEIAALVQSRFVLRGGTSLWPLRKG
jgi:hypothetical protein